MNKKSIMLVTLCVGLAIMAIAYSAFSTTLKVNGTTAQIGSFGIVLTGCSCTKTAGLTGATAPTGSCTPSGTTESTTGTVTASFNQPGDTVTCTFNVKNKGNLKAKANGSASCTPSGGVTTTESSSLTTPIYYTQSWKKTALAAGATATGEITITLKYSSNITSQPSTTTGTVSCTFPYTQDI